MCTVCKFYVSILSATFVLQISDDDSLGYCLRNKLIYNCVYMNHLELSATWMIHNAAWL